MNNISISICPTSLQFDNGDTYDEQKLLAAIRSFIEEHHTKATISCLQIGHRQGDAWATLDGDSEDGEALLAWFYEKHGNDEDLFVEDEDAELRQTGIGLSAETLCKLSGLSLEDWGLDEGCTVVVFPDCINGSSESGHDLPDLAAGNHELEKKVWAAAVKLAKGGDQ